MPQTPERRLEWYQENKERISAQRRARYREEHPHREKLKAARTSYYQRHRAACRARAAKQRADRGTDGERDYKLRLAYGISLAEYNEMLKQQGGVCRICGGISQRKLAVDHDHKHPQKVRSLLCSRCNSGLGQFRDDPELLRQAAAYLEMWQQQSEVA